MPWSELLLTLGGFAGTALGGGFVGTLLQRRSQLKEKHEDRDAARDDAHRDQLRHAYGEFFGTYSKYLDIAGLIYSLESAIREQQDEAYQMAIERGADAVVAETFREGGGHPELLQKSRKAVDDLNAAVTEVTTKGTNVLLLEHDPDRAALLVALVHGQILFPQSRADYERFLRDQLEQRGRMNTLMTALTGTFSPVRWYAPKGAATNVATTPKQLDTPKQGALKAGEK